MTKLRYTSPGVGFLDTRYVNATGDTMTGNLTMPAESFIGPSSTTGIYFKGGNIGIGTTSPGQKFQVDGKVVINSGTNVAQNYRDLYIGGFGGWATNEAHSINFVYNTAASPSIVSSISSIWDGTWANLSFVNDISSTTPVLFLRGNGRAGIGTTSPDAKLQVVGDTMFGDNGSNYASFASDGELTLTGTARVTRDLWIDAAGIKAPGAKPATEVSFGTLEVSAWEFSDEGVEANQESVSWRIAIPYDMDRNEGVVLRVGWSSASPGNCKWQLKYRWFSEDEDLTQDGEETLTAVDAASTTANGLVVTTITGINAPSATDATIMFKLTRLSADAEDTISDTVELHGVCFNYTSDKLGEAL